jgi:hypothetical protein
VSKMLSEMQTLILWALLGKGGASLQKDIKPAINKSDREALARAGLIAVGKLTRQGYPIEVTERGWAWAAEHLGADLPKRSPAGSAVLQAWLTRLKVFMDARDVILADILGPQTSGRAQPPHQDAMVPRPGLSSGYPALRERVRTIYREVAGGFNRRALLRDIRARLQDVDRAMLDEVLKRMQREGDAALMQFDNKLEITDADRAAALQIGHEQRHILWIEQ